MQWVEWLGGKPRSPPYEGNSPAQLNPINTLSCDQSADDKDQHPNQNGVPLIKRGSYHKHHSRLF